MLANIAAVTLIPRMEHSDHQAVSLKSCRKTGPGGLMRPMSDGGLVLGGTLPSQRLSGERSSEVMTCDMFILCSLRL